MAHNLRWVSVPFMDDKTLTIYRYMLKKPNLRSAETDKSLGSFYSLDYIERECVHFTVRGKGKYVNAVFIMAVH